MRDIKFRVFFKDPEEPVVIFPAKEIHFIGGNAELIYFDSILRNRCVKQVAIEKCELMQYTGLKDKNGKEIYEGDIVLRRAHFFGDLFVGDVKGIIKYEAASFYIEGNKIDPEIVSEDLEVIGNIHENLNLMEVKND